MSEYWELKEKGLVKVLVRNAVRCIACDSILESKTRHDYVKCHCPNETACDGGLEYQRTLAVDLDKIEDLCKYIIMTEQEYEDMLERKRIKEAEILQQKIDAGLMVEFGGKYIHKSTWKLIMDNCLKLGDK